MDNNWHSLSNEQIISKLDIKKTGLSEKEVEERRLRYGRNVLSKEKEPTLIGVFFKQFKNPILIILIIAGCLSIFIGEDTNVIFIAIITILNAIFGTYQEYNKVKSSHSIENMLKIKAKVIRNKKTSIIEAKDLVVRRYSYIRARKQSSC